MGESAYEELVAGVNEFLKENGISDIIGKKDSGNPRLEEALGRCKSGSGYRAAMFALSALSRHDDAKKLSENFWGGIYQ